ncbi:MAG: FHA domain-containing protein [Vicinamibacteria bacterium]
MSVLRLIPLKGEAIVVDADEAIVGREANCNVVVSHPSVSRRHALIKRKQDVFFLVDQGSANGTFVDSKRIVDATLKDGSVLRFGSASFKVELRDELPVESIAEDELELAQTMVGSVAPQSFSATVVEGNTLPVPDEMATPHYGTDMRAREAEPAPTVQSPVLKPPKPPEPRPEPQRAPRSAPAPVAPPPPPAAPAAAAPNRGPAFWLMIAASALALLFVGAALGLAAAFIAKRMGWL